ncbi:MAG: hypothetical protein EWM72_02913 [Nitrospira sp.]|nr:MAG: hypothetical protein EWM72_02913 [Nitrospira sp.]
MRFTHALAIDGACEQVEEKFRIDAGLLDVLESGKDGTRNLRVCFDPLLLWHFLGESFEVPFPSLMLRREVVDGYEGKPCDLRGVAEGLTHLSGSWLREIPVELSYRDNLADIVKPAHVNLDGGRDA